MSDGEALSHSQVVEWILLSRIQSHWPCITLWPISIFSTIFATESPTVPASHAGGNRENNSTARLSRTCWRMASSSRPRFSMSSPLRWAIGLCSWRCRVVMKVPLEVDVAGARCCGHTGLDQDAVTGCGGGDVAVAKVAHGSLAQRCHAAEADAHPASRRHQDSGGFAGVEQCLVARGVEDCRGLGEGDGAAL